MNDVLGYGKIGGLEFVPREYDPREWSTGSGTGTPGGGIRGPRGGTRDPGSGTQAPGGGTRLISTI